MRLLSVEVVLMAKLGLSGHGRGLKYGFAGGRVWHKTFVVSSAEMGLGGGKAKLAHERERGRCCKEQITGGSISLNQKEYQSSREKGVHS